MKTDATARAEARARALVRLVREHLPLSVRPGAGRGSWAVAGPALVARMAGTVEAMVTLRPLNREADALCLLRVLFEHAVLFAWLAAERSGERLACWRKHDALERLKADNDSRQDLGISLLDDENRAIVEREAVIKGVGKLPAVSALAAADRYWSKRLPEAEPDGQTSFRGQYVLIYRHASGLMHPTFRGLNHVIYETPTHQLSIDLEGTPKKGGPLGVSSCVFGLALFVAGESLGWPRREAITGVFDCYDEGAGGDV